MTKFGPLKTHIRGSTRKGGPVIMLMHGFGASGTDLVGLETVLRAPESARFVFPEAPVELGLSFGGGRAWWMIDVVQLQAALARGQFRDLAREEPKGLDEARNMLLQTIEAIDAEFEPSAWVIGGFSQGAMLATDVALRSERRFKALTLFSGTIVAEKIWSPLFQKCRGLEIALSHGQQDPLLPFFAAERLRSLFEEGGADVHFQPFTGGHEIPPEALENANRVLERVLAEL